MTSTICCGTYVGVLLQSEGALTILQPEYYRPWPKIRSAEENSVTFYKILDRTRDVDLAELRSYERTSR